MKSLGTLVYFFVRCVARTWYYRWWTTGGNLRPWHCVKVGFFVNIAKIDIKSEYYKHHERYALHGGPRRMYDNYAIVSDSPDTISMDDRGRRHCASGPAISWRDGFAMYYWHGVRVPRRVVEAPESYTAQEIGKIRNSEISRALAERLGWDKFLERIGCRVLDSVEITATGEDGQDCSLRYELLESDLQFADGQPLWLRMQSPVLRDGTQPWYIEPVDPRLKSAAAARTWRTRNTDGEWPSVRDCNDGALPDWSVRQGDLVFHASNERNTDGLKQLIGAALVTGSSTGHSHTLVGSADVFELPDGRRLIHRTGKSLSVEHQEHHSVDLPEWSIQSVARQYDSENGWVNVED